MVTFKIIYTIVFITHIFELKGFLFSVIIPIYNAGRYLDDSIGSIINQTIGLKYIQIILVNDGSTDKTEEICLKYQKKYNKNIFYIKIGHTGVSKARNIGMIYAKGKYINFLDCDDKWDAKAFKYILLFFKYYKNIDYVSGRIKFFEALNEYHPLDYKFYKTRIVNLSIEYSCIQLQASSSVFKKKILDGKFFKEDISFSEDTRLLNSILLLNPIMGVIRESLYYYRRREDLSSAIQKKYNNLYFYFGAINSVFTYFIDISKSLYNKVLPFIQFIICYEFLFRLQMPAYKYLDSSILKKYIELFENILKQIEDKYILEQKILTNKYKLFMLSKKYHKDLRFEIKFENNSFNYLNYNMINLNTERNVFSWKILTIKNSFLYLEAIDNFWMLRENFFYFCKIGNKIIFPKYIENQKYKFENMYGVIEKGRAISFKIPLEKYNFPLILYFYLSYLNENIEIFPSLGMFSHIPNIDTGYCVFENYIIKYSEKRLIIFQYNSEIEKEFEQLYCNELHIIKKDGIIKLRKNHLNWLNNNKKNKLLQIWLINDNKDKAGGNGEYFFRYLVNEKPNYIQPYFAIIKNCSDYSRLQKLGGIIDLNSDKYKEIFLKSDKIISSVYNGWIYNPFNKDEVYLRDLFHFDLVYLQNCILKDDLSNYINKIDKNFNLIITSSKYEYKYILKNQYGYKENNIILTGMPSYDYLNKLQKEINIEKKIIIIPTWRKAIKKERDYIYNNKSYSDSFKETKFYEFYNKLINDKNLLLIMKKYNYTGTFCLHPFFESQWIDFNKNEIFSIIHYCDYPKLLLESSLLITDYSSIFFDFGYIKRPVIYTHFDYEDYRNTHYQKGYFDYKKDGFGPICNNIQCTVNEIIFEIQNNCILKKKYFQRIKRFFIFFDQNNSERIFYEILKSKYKNNKNRINLIFLILYFTILIKIIKNIYYLYIN